MGLLGESALRFGSRHGVRGQQVRYIWQLAVRLFHCPQTQSVFFKQKQHFLRQPSNVGKVTAAFNLNWRVMENYQFYQPVLFYFIALHISRQKSLIVNNLGWLYIYNVSVHIHTTQNVLLTELSITFLSLLEGGLMTDTATVNVVLYLVIGSFCFPWLTELLITLISEWKSPRVKTLPNKNDIINQQNIYVI